VADTITAEEVGRVLLYVAPGFFAVKAWQYRFPQRQREHFETLVVSAAVSVPLVALVDVFRRKLDITRNPLSLSYVTLLLGVSIVVGYAAALIRGTDRARSFLVRLGSDSDPESAVLARTVARVPRENSRVVVLFSDGRVLSGCPHSWTRDPDANVRELFLSYAAWWDETADEGEGEWEDQRDHGGVLVNLADVMAIEVLDDPR
jgi:hypothetical protein